MQAQPIILANCMPDAEAAQNIVRKEEGTIKPHRVGSFTNGVPGPGGPGRHARDAEHERAEQEASSSSSSTVDENRGAGALRVIGAGGDGRIGSAALAGVMNDSGYCASQVASPRSGPGVVSVSEFPGSWRALLSLLGSPAAPRLSCDDFRFYERKRAACWYYMLVCSSFVLKF